GLRRGRRCVSIFLHPFAPPALPGFIAATSALTPARERGLAASSALLHPCRPPCFTQSVLHAIGLPSPPSPATDPLPWSPCHLTPQRHAPARLSTGSGLRHWIAGSPDGTAESSWLSYGWFVRFLLLSTPASWRRSYIRLRPE